MMRMVPASTRSASAGAIWPVNRLPGKGDDQILDRPDLLTHLNLLVFDSLADGVPIGLNHVAAVRPVEDDPRGWYDRKEPR